MSKKQTTKSKKEYIYLDNNGTTIPYKEVLKISKDWAERPINSSASGPDSKKAQEMEENATNMFKCLNYTTSHDVIFTSGASESNNLMIRSVVDSWYMLKRNNKVPPSSYIAETLKLDRPRIVTTSVEHASIGSCLKQLLDSKQIDLTVIKPDIYGQIEREKMEELLKTRKGIILVTFIFANNELGTINEIGTLMGMVKAHNKDIITHSDTVQIYGKMRLNLPKLSLDACSASFHKLGGLIGVGLLMLDKSVNERFGGVMVGQISGKQQNNLRGGTFSSALISAAAVATCVSFDNRDEKNVKLAYEKDFIIKSITQQFPIISYIDVLSDKYDKKTTQICILGAKKSLFNTILLSIIEPNYTFCNVKFKKALIDDGIIVSIGSACNTKSKNASHVLNEIQAPEIVKRGVIRISLGDVNTHAEIQTFVKRFLKLLEKKYILD